LEPYEGPPYPFPKPVSQARAILAHAPLLAEYVMSGQVSFSKAYREALLRSRQDKRMTELGEKMKRERVY
jgi:hypothetical protein